MGGDCLHNKLAKVCYIKGPTSEERLGGGGGCTLLIGMPGGRGGGSTLLIGSRGQNIV